MNKTKEPQNQPQIEEYRRKGPAQFGPWTSNIWRHDPRHLGFLLARYKFVAKMLSGRKRVVEIGCGDGIGIPVLLQEVGFVHGIDVEPLVLEDARIRFNAEGILDCSFEMLDATEQPLRGPFEGACSLDVIEHVPQEHEERYMTNICVGLTDHGVCLIGTPNVTASAYATEGSRIGHINLKSAQTLRALLDHFFHNVFLFSMNDEVVHTGYAPMAHYLFAMGVDPKR